MNPQLFMDTAKAMVAEDKGPLAMDESSPTCNKRFPPLGIDSWENEGGEIPNVPTPQAETAGASALDQAQPLREVENPMPSATGSSSPEGPVRDSIAKPGSTTTSP